MPVVLTIDVEPDRRRTDRDHASTPFGFERILELEPRMRDQLSRLSDSDARFTWCLRMDPQIADTYGDAAWFATEYEKQWSRVADARDVIGLHPHSWRWRDGWVSDQGDDDWVAHCMQLAMHTYQSTFRRPCAVYRHGDGFMSNALARQLDEAGVRVDLTIEPGSPARRGILAEEASTGWLPDTRDVPSQAYRPSASDFRKSDATKSSGLIMMPLTSGLSVETQLRDGRLVPTGTYECLALWTEPVRFARMLRAHLRQPGVSHLAFAVRADIGLLPTAWSSVEENVAEVCRQLEGRHQWCTALEALELVDPGAVVARPEAEEPADRAARASAWLHGVDDPGFRARAEPEAYETLMEDAGRLVARVQSLGLDAGPSASSDPEASTVPGEGLMLDWVEAEDQVECPTCGREQRATRFLEVTNPRIGAAPAGVLRCARCRTVVPEWSRTGYDMTDEAIDEHIEFYAGLDAMLTTLSAVEPRAGLRFLDVGCGYGFGLDLARFAWGWDVTGVDPWNTALRGRDELHLDIRTKGLDAEPELQAGQFDVVLASETLEHVPDPAGFLRQVRACLADDGVLVMSTPNAAFVAPGNPVKEVVAALGTGGHRCLVERGGLETLLHDAGFDAVVVDEADTSVMALRAVASPTAAGLARCRALATSPDFDLLVRYCDARADEAPSGSALRLGMAARHVQYALHAGDGARAEAGFARLRDALRERHGLDIDEPAATSARASASGVPVVAAAAHYSAGFLDLVVRDRPERAARQFAAAAVAASVSTGGPSPAPMWLQMRALGHEALALARSDPARAPEALGRMRRAAQRLIGADVAEVEALSRQVVSELAREQDDADSKTKVALDEDDRALQVSVVIPVYNGRRHLAEAVESLATQTRPPVELIVIDDGSSDDGPAVLEAVDAPFPIRIVRQARAGQSTARNRGVELAQGELLAFLDQDDTWHPHHLEAMCAHFEDAPLVGWVFSDFDEIDEDGRTVTLSFLRENSVQHPRRTLTACLAQNLMVIPSASVMRRSMFTALGGFDEQLQGYEDDDLYVRAFRAGWQLVFEPQSLTRFRVHPSSSSANSRFAESRRRFCDKLELTVPDDRRLSRYYMRDVVAPRFFQDALNDYVRAVGQRDWDGAQARLLDLDHFAALHRNHATLRWKLTALRNPQLFRRMLRANDAIPFSPRIMRDSAFRLREPRE
ncbi:MAG: glycosyltransferase [Acidimicrobiia bacterium]